MVRIMKASLAAPAHVVPRMIWSPCQHATNDVVHLVNNKTYLQKVEHA